MIGDIKNIIIIKSLNDKRKTGEEIYNDCIRRKIDYQIKDFYHKLHQVKTKKDFFDILEYYIYNCPFMRKGFLIHLEMHGDENKKGLFTSDNSLITWEELNSKFREINVIINGTLFITMATCHGRYLYLGTNPYKKSPFSGYISASMTVYPDEIVDNFFILFENLIDNGNLIEAYLKMEKQKSNFYYKDRETVFKQAFNNTLEKLYGDTNLKNQIISDAEKQVFKETGTKFSELEKNNIFEKAILDIYNKQYEAFKL